MEVRQTPLQEAIAKLKKEIEPKSGKDYYESGHEAGVKLAIYELESLLLAEKQLLSDTWDAAYDYAATLENNSWNDPEDYQELPFDKETYLSQFNQQP